MYSVPTFSYSTPCLGLLSDSLIPIPFPETGSPFAVRDASGAPSAPVPPSVTSATTTGVPFGQYDYAGSLGWKLLSVPVVIPLAWAMMAYPCLLVGQRLASTQLGAVAVGAWALASWDLFLDPQMVDAGHWTWTDVQLALPGLPGIPVSNYLGWLLVATLMMTALQRLPRRPACRADDRVPYALFLWTYASSVLAHAAFFGRPAVALVGGVGMGLVALPFARSLQRSSPQRSG